MKLLLSIICSTILSFSWSQETDKTVPFTNILTVTVKSSGAILFDMSNRQTRIYTLDEMLRRHKLTLSTLQKDKFYGSGTVGSSMANLPAWLGLSPEKQEEKTNSKEFIGIPANYTIELEEWIQSASNSAFRASKEAYDESSAGVERQPVSAFTPQFVLHAEKGAPSKQLVLVANVLRRHELEKSPDDTIPAQVDAPVDIRFTKKVYEVREEMYFGDPPPAPPMPEPAKSHANGIETIVDEPAGFPGGPSALNKYLADNLRYPAAAKEAQIQGKCYVKFVVAKDGTISQANVVKGVVNCTECNNEALRLVQSMPKWKPARNNGKIVASYFNLPITFRFE